MYPLELIKRNKQAKYGASYILPNGEVLKCINYGCVTHLEYETLLIKRGELPKFKGGLYRQLTNLNQWIRINDGTNVEYEVLAELPIKGITEEQYKALEVFFDYLREKGKNIISIGVEEHSVGTHFTDKSLWYDTIDLTKFTNKEIEFFIRDAYRTFEMYPSN